MKFDLSKSVIFLLYNKYKDYLLPIAIIVISFILLMLFTIPQISSLSERQQEVKVEKEKLVSLQNNLNILTNLNDSTLNSQVSILSDSLPSGKNFSEVLNSISISANKSGIFLGDFDFHVGDLSNTVIPAKGFPNLQLSLTVKGDFPSIVKFINELYRSLPVAEVTRIELGGSQAQLDTLFYYKPYLGKDLDGTQELSNLTKSDIDTIKQLSSWNNPRVYGEIQPLISPSPSPTASASRSAF